MTKRLGDAPIQPEYVAQMQHVAVALDMFFNGDARTGVDRKTGFVLLVFDYGEGEGRCNYISNGARSQGHRDAVQRADSSFRGATRGHRTCLISIVELVA